MISFERPSATISPRACRQDPKVSEYERVPLWLVRGPECWRLGPILSGSQVQIRPSSLLSRARQTSEGRSSTFSLIQELGSRGPFPLPQRIRRRDQELLLEMVRETFLPCCGILF